MLWDSVQFVNNSWRPEEEEGDYSPHVVAITGWGQPGSDDASDDSELRKRWRAWCAIHRQRVPEYPNQLPLLILEFELENDDVNPLYPPEPESSLFRSPADGYTESGATTTGILLDSRTQSLRVDDNTTVRSIESAGFLPDIHGLDGEHEWRPSPQDVLESTTSRSKPLTALQRLRKLKTPHSARSTVDSDGSPSPVRRKERVRRDDFSGGVGMMDVFALMSQVNEQFGNASDLGTFLNIVVGVVKELTRFHRVLVYQFDEVWNRSVVAELVDRSKTCGLFRGLHFPASDISPQASVPIRILINWADGDAHQARELYALSKFVPPPPPAGPHFPPDKVRLLYDRDQPTARLIAKSEEDLEPPLVCLSLCVLWFPFLIGLVHRI